MNTVVIKNTKWKSYIIATIAFFTLIFIFEIIPDYSSLFSDLWQVINRNSLQTEINNYQSQITGLEKENYQLHSSEASFSSANRNNGDISSVISFLDLLSQKSFVKNYSLKPGSVVTKDNLTVLPLEVEINGDYSQAFNYIRFIERSSRVVIIKSLSIKQNDISKDSLNIKTNLDVYLNL